MPELRRCPLLAHATRWSHGDFSLSSRPPFQSANTIKHQSLRWAIDDHIALDDVTLFTGPKKCGKSLFAAHLSACFTNGIPFAPGVDVNENARGHVLLYTAERPKESFAAPRSEAAGADGSKLFIRDKNYSLEDVIADIQESPRNVRLIIIDPLKSYVDVAHISDKNARQLLDKLGELARQRNAAIVIMHHITLRDRKSNDATDYIQGKRVWVEAPLCAWMICRLHDGFMMENVASNKRAGQRYEFQIVAHKLKDGTETERLEVLGKSKHSIIDALNGASRLMMVKTKRERAREWLCEYLKDGPKLRNAIYATGLLAGHSEPTLMRAKQDGGIEDRKRLGDGLSEWFLPVVTDSVESVDAVEEVGAPAATQESTESSAPKPHSHAVGPSL